MSNIFDIIPMYTSMLVYSTLYIITETVHYGCYLAFHCRRIQIDIEKDVYRCWTDFEILFRDRQVEALAQNQGIETMTNHTSVVVLRFPDLVPRSMASSTRVGRTGGQNVVYWTRSFDWPDFDVEVERSG
jgi:hypothetical protein